MLKWLRSAECQPLIVGALTVLLSVNLLACIGVRDPNVWVAIFTLTLTASTMALWWSTNRLAREARNSATTLITTERPYVTGGGDFDNRTGVELFRLDVENHGKTAAFMTGYDLRFAKLKELQEETEQAKEIRPVCKNRYRHIDGISPAGARKRVYTQIPMEPDADVVYGAVYYVDPIQGCKHHSRFILRINATRDIPCEGLTRLDVDGVSEEYWSWDYRKTKQS